jgi:predicted ATP-grasp superfamily ATP-dependent carboligase
LNGHYGDARAPAFVMTMANYYGSLAATQCLGARRVRVIVADPRRFAPARWSRHVVRREACPPEREVDAFIEWMLEFGARDPGQVLYATSDDLAWIFAEHQAELRKVFRLLSPPFESVERVLDKASLHDECIKAGLRPPKTWFPRGDDDLGTIVREARFPVIIKPRTQVLFRSMAKGRIVASAGELASAYRRSVREAEYDVKLIARYPDFRRPMVQELHDSGPIYAISGFCDPRQGLFVARGSRKLIQWPRRAGVGIAFEDVPVNEKLAAGLRKLSESTRFFGVFEAEFVGTEDPRLIDYNPRFFGQMGFDAARGLPSPYLVYLAATENHRLLADEVALAAQWRSRGPMVYVNRTALAWTRAVERVVGRTPASLPERLVANTPMYVDAVDFGRDWAPAVVDGVGQILGVLRHPRSALRVALRGH